jgi:eukaryotic-like serine/threonine-protein kinase
MTSAPTMGGTSEQTAIPAGSTPDAATSYSPPVPAPFTLSVGHDFGTRYHIIRVLGKGGMGAVYQAWDKTLEVAVAIKVIRPEASANPEEAKALERRFKRELLLARQVTHRNVVRIHDLGEIDGITYITMPYVHGSDLATVLKKEGRLPLDRVLHIARHVASGLAAAHEAGVVHRDLKPANIMLEDEDGALIMDFGIARSTSGTGVGMTVAGAVVGTVQYMAPEQAQGQPVDQRADIYSFGLILHDMLAGRRDGGASTSISELMQRMRSAPPPLRSSDPAIPEWLDALVTKCLQPEPAARWQSMNEVVAVIDQAVGGHSVTIPQTAVIKPTPFAGRRGLAAAAVALLVLAGAGYFAWTRFSAPQSPTTETVTADGPTIAVAVLPFRNASGESGLDRLGQNLNPLLISSLGQSARVRTVAPDRMNQVLSDLKIAPNATLTRAELARVADWTKTQHVIWGQFTRLGDAISITANIQDLERNETEAVTATAPNEAGLIPAVSQLAAGIQTALAKGSSDVLSELKQSAWKPTTSSVEALTRYNEGVQLMQQGAFQPALKSYEAAIKEDGNFALALSAISQTYSALGYDDQAAAHSRQAMSLADNLPPQEKYRIAAHHYRMINDNERALDAYENIIKASPNDVMIRLALGQMYEARGRLDEAHEQFATIVRDDPKLVEALLGLGRVEIFRNNPQAALEHLTQAQGLAVQLEGRDQTRANVLQALGIAHFRLNRATEALRLYEESLAIKRKIGDRRGMAASFVQIAEVKKTLGEPRVAEQNYREAEKLRREINDRAGLMITLIDLSTLYHEELGRPKEALPLLGDALRLARDTGNVPVEARALNNIGTVNATLGNYAEAQTNFERALELRQKAKSPREAADTLHNLAETFVRMGRYDLALQRYDEALTLRRDSNDRRNAAIAEQEIGTILELQGRFGAAAESKQRAVQTFRDLGQRDSVLSEGLSAYGRSLALSGRTTEAEAPLKEALALASELKNTRLISRAQRYLAERLAYRGDLKAALQAAAEAEQSAKQTDRVTILQGRITAAIIASLAQPTRAVAGTLATLAKEAESQGLRALATECNVQRARTLLALNDHAAAQQEADRAIAVAEGLGLRVPQAVAHYVRAVALNARGDSGARREYAAALRLLEQVRNDTGNDKVFERADLAPIEAESRKGSSGP